MKLFVSQMNKELAEEILKWKYDPPYDFYNNEFNSDHVIEMMENPYYAVVDANNRLIGFFCIGKPAQVPSGDKYGAYMEEMVDLGIGMNPALTGKGFGAEFFSFIIQYMQANFEDISIRLTVAKFNERAIHLYEKFGFDKIKEFAMESTAFQIMVKSAR